MMANSPPVCPNCQTPLNEVAQEWDTTQWQNWIFNPASGMYDPDERKGGHGGDTVGNPSRYQCANTECSYTITTSDDVWQQLHDMDAD